MDGVQVGRDGEEEAAAPAIRALGSLFKLTQVFLWDDGSAETRQPSSFIGKSRGSEDDAESKVASTALDYSLSSEDMELIRQMSELGLPLTFQSGKEKTGMSKARKKSTYKMNAYGIEEIENEVSNFPQVSEMDAVSRTDIHDNPSGFLCSMSLMGQSESSCSDNAVDASKTCCTSGDGEDSMSMATVSYAIKEPVCGRISDVAGDSPEFYSLETGDISKNDSAVNSSAQDHEMVGELLSRHPSTELSVGCCNDELRGSLLESESFVDFSPTNSAECGMRAFSSRNKFMSPEEVDLQGEEMLPIEVNDYETGGEWRVFWDSHYQRNYYYNVRTHVSTWFVPSGTVDESRAYFENCESDERLVELTEGDACVSLSKPVDSCALQISADSFENFMDNDKLYGQPKLADESDTTILKDCERNTASQIQEHISMINGMTEVDPMENHLNIEIRDPTANDLYLPSVSHVRKVKKKTKRHMQRKSSHASEELNFPLSEEYCTVVEKYWFQRYLLFSRFDEGIKMDEEGWFSVTPESIARHHALRCGGGTVIDGFAGVGGNSIQFALNSQHVVAVDIDAKRIEYAHHNAVIYHVDGAIDFVKGDFFNLAPKLKADTIFLSPPWGGPGYTKVKTYDLKMLKPQDGFFLFNIAKEVAPKVVMFLPRNVDLNQLAELSLSVQPPWSLEVEENYLNGKLKSITAYFSRTKVNGS